MDIRHLVFQDPDSLDEIFSIGIMFRQTGGDGKHVHIENNITCRNICLFCEQTVHSAADLDSAIEGIRLTVFIECHTQQRGTETACFFRMFKENFFTFFEADGVDNAFPLRACKTCTDRLKVGGVDHDRDPGNIRFSRQTEQKTGKLRRCIQHGIVHIDVNDRCAVFDLIPGNVQGFFHVTLFDETQKFAGTRHIGSFTHIEEGEFRIGNEGIQSCKTQSGRNRFQRTGCCSFQCLCNGTDVIRVCAAAATGDVEQTFICKRPEDRPHFLWSLFVPPQFIRQTGVGVGGDPAGGFAGEFGDVWLHFRSTQRTIEPDGKQVRCVHHRDEKRLHILPGEQSAGSVGECAGDHHGDWFAAPFFFEFGDGVDGGFCVKRVKDCFNEQNIGAPVQQPCGSFMVCVCQFKKSQFAEGGICHGRGHGKGLACGTDGPGNEPGLSGREFCEGISGAAGDCGTGAVQLVNFIRQSVFRL